MSTNYTIHFSDPLLDEATLTPGERNGPGAGSPLSSIMLHGAGTLDWGEAVNEDLLILLENFASASPPESPRLGQLWVSVALYHNTAPGVFHRWKFMDGGGMWEDISADIDLIEPPAPAEGEYYIDGTTLFGYYIKAPNTTPAWIERTYTSGATLPASPRIQLILFGVDAVPTTVQLSRVANTQPDPNSVNPGDLWYDTTTNQLFVFDGTTWQPIVTGAVSGTLTFPNMALNQGGGNTSVGSDIRFLSNPGVIAADQTLHINVNAQGVGTNALVVGTGTDDTSAIPLFTVGQNGTIASAVPSYTSLVSGGSTGVLTNKGYVDAAVSSVATSAATIYAGSGAYNIGQIAIVSGKVYIAVTAGTGAPVGGGWRQIFPAVYA